MTRNHKIESWTAALIALSVVATVVTIAHYRQRKTRVLRGAVIVQNADPRKESPIAGVVVSAGDLGASEVTSDSSGLFVLNLRNPVRKGQPIVLHFKHEQYEALDLKDVAANKLYIVHLAPLANTSAQDNQPQIKVSNVRVRYTVKEMTEVNVGSAVKTFQIENKGNVSCKGHRPCSPDGKWKASAGSASLDAGPGNEVRSARVSCIAGPCPFTNIDADHFSDNRQSMTVSALDWSDTATFLVEAEVLHRMVSQAEHWTYPVVFGSGLSFTLPSDAESESMEADLNGQTIIFPLGPTLILSWANCDTESSPDQGRVYRCAAKPGYKFQ